MKRATSKSLTRRQTAEIKHLREMREDQIDVDDIPQMRDWTGAKRGLFYRPVKQQITLRIDADILDWFRRQAREGRLYQTAINDALRRHIRRHARRKTRTKT